MTDLSPLPHGPEPLAPLDQAARSRSGGADDLTDARKHIADTVKARKRQAASNLSPKLDITVIRDQAGLEAIEDEWNRLFDDAALHHHHFLRFNWNWHWVRHYATPSGDRSPIELCVVAGRSQGRLVLICPLVRQRHGGITEIKWMGDPVTQYGDILVADAEHANLWMKQAFDYSCKCLGGDVISLRKVRGDANIAEVLHAANATITERQDAPYIDLTRFKTYEDYFKLFGKKARKNRRRHRRRMEEEGEISYSFHRAGPMAGGLAAEAIALKRAWIEDRGLVSRAYSDTRLEDFFSNACASTERPVQPYVTKWDVDGETATIELGLEHGRTHIAHVGVYHPKHERHSPGTLQMEDTIRSCIDRGLERYDLMAPADAYKRQWCDKSVPVYDFAAPGSLLGQVYVTLVLKLLRPGAKWTLAQVPGSLRRPLAAILGRMAKLLG